jgi:hypothetical protein
MARTDQILWVGSLLSSWKGECGGRCPKPQLMQPSHSPVSLVLLWSRRTESPSCSTWHIEQHNPYSNYQRRCHCSPKEEHWNGSSLLKSRVGRSLMLLTRCRRSSMVQGPSCGSERLWASLQDHRRGPMVVVFYPSGNQQDVSRFEEEFLVDKKEARDCEVYVWMWNMLKCQGRSSATCWKPTTLEHSWVEMGKHIYGLHCGFASHLTWV